MLLHVFFVGKFRNEYKSPLPLDDAENYTYVRTVITVAENHKWLKEVGCHVSLPRCCIELTLVSFLYLLVENH
jgi:hypothetical protein